MGAACAEGQGEMSMKRILTAVAVIAVLVGCSSGGAGGTVDPGDIVSVGISGADGYARVWNSPAQLVRVDQGEPTHVDWTTDKGETVSVPVDEAKLVGNGFMLLKYTYEGESYTQMARKDTGELVDVPSPDNADRMVNRAKSYYVAGAKILSVDPSNGKSAVLSGDETVPGSAFLAVNESDIPFAFTNSYKRSFPAAGPRDLSGSPSAIRYYSTRNSETSSGSSTQSSVYDPVADQNYLIDWQAQTIRKMMLNDTGSVTEQDTTSFASPIAEARRIGSGQATPDNSYWTNGYDNLYEITALDPLTLNAIPLDKQPSIWLDEAQLVDGKFYYRENTDSPTTMSHVRELDIATGEERVLIDSHIDSLQEWQVVGGAVIWIDDAGSWKTDLSTLKTTAYSASDVEAVRE